MPERCVKWYGYRVDLPDIRDRSLALPAPGISLPPSVDLRSGFPPCYDQGNLGSCVGNAVGGAIEYDRRKQGIKDWLPSRLFIYYNARLIEGTEKEDAGCEIRDAIKSINSDGAPNERYWKYYVTKFDRKPPKNVYDRARKHLSVTYERVEQNLNAFKQALALGFPIILGFSVYDAFESDQVAKSGVLNMPTASEALVGGHAVVAVGYDDHQSRFLIRNSWNTDWGMEGYFTMPYGYLMNPDLAEDFWTLTKVK